MARYALVAFNGEAMCFAHVLLNALDMHARGHDVVVVIEGSATWQVAELADPKKPFADAWNKVKQAGLVKAVCQACSAKMGALEAARQQGLPIAGEMQGHPSLAVWLEQGYHVVTF